MIYGVPEQVSNDTTPDLISERMKQYKMIVREVCPVATVEIYEDDIADIRRVGKYTNVMGSEDRSSKTRDRPLVVTPREGIRDKILRNAYRVKNSTGKNCEILRKVIHSQDMNKEERQRDKELLEEAKKKKGMRVKEKLRQETFMW